MGPAAKSGEEASNTLTFDVQGDSCKNGQAPECCGQKEQGWGGRAWGKEGRKYLQHDAPNRG